MTSAVWKRSDLHINGENGCQVVYIKSNSFIKYSDEQEKKKRRIQKMKRDKTS